MQLRNKWIVTMSVFLLAATLGTAQSSSSVTTNDVVPRLVKFSGSMKDHAGPTETGIKGVTFALYKDQYGGAPLWLETQNVRIDSKGNYTALLGSTKPEGLPADLFASNEARWLGIQPEGQAEQPRVVFVSVPYALKAADAETIGGLPPSAFVRANPATAVAGSTESQSASIAAVGSKNAPPATLNVITPPPGQPAGFVPLWTGTSPTHTLGSSVLFENGSKQIGLNTKTPGASLEIDSTNQLGLFLHAPFSGNVGTGLDFFTTGSGGRQWEILATGSAAAQGPGKLNIRDVTSGKDIFTISSLDDTVGIGTTNPGGAALTAVSNNANSAVLGQNKTSDGSGVEGSTTGIIDFNSGVIGASLASTGVTYGVNGVNNSTDFFAAGVEGDSFATSGQALGTVGTTASPHGTGVWGLALGISNIGKGIGCCPVGVWGDTASNAGGAAGLVGTADDGRAIYLENNSPSGVPTAFMRQDASGQLALVAGGLTAACTIDTKGHENCPGNFSTTASVNSGKRQVALYSVQSPQNWFEDFGSGQLAGGTASVTLEGTFAQTVNASSEYHVFLTPEGDCRGLYVSKKTPAGFEVRELGGGRSTVAFDYRIVAIRRGFEGIRMEDMTERLKKATAPMPNASPGTRFTMPRRRAVPGVSAKSDVATYANPVER
jgi:hypothetical protein